MRFVCNIALCGFCFIHLCSTALAVESADATVLRLDGTLESGKLISFSDTQIELSSENGKLVIARESIKSIRFGEYNKIEAEKAHIKFPLALELRDGSISHASEISGSSDLWQVETAQGRLLLAANSLSQVRFRQLDEKETLAWESIKAEKRSADEIVISRGMGNVDRASGVINSINKDTVAFDFEGQSLNAPRAKLVGVIWMRQPLERIQPGARIVLIDGSVWLATKIQWNARGDTDQLKWKTAIDIDWSCPSNQVVEIDMSAANVRWLAEADMLERKATSRVSVQSPITIRDKLFGPQFVSPNALANQSDQDLVFASPGEITFRVPEGFQYYAAKIGRRSTGDSQSQVSVEIWQADERLFQAVLPDDLSDIAVKVSVTPGKRLRIAVVSDSSLAAGTKVQWTQPRFER